MKRNHEGSAPVTGPMACSPLRARGWRRGGEARWKNADSLLTARPGVRNGVAKHSLAFARASADIARNSRGRAMRPRVF